MGPDEIPVDCPSPTDIRTVGQWLAHQFPADVVLSLIRAKDYTAAHELAGVHEAISAVMQLADDVEQQARDEANAQEVIL